MKVREVMIKNVDIIAADDTVEQAARKMEMLDIGDLPVVMDSEAVGMVTDRDIVLRAVAPGLDPAGTKVMEAMTKGLAADPAHRKERPAFYGPVLEHRPCP